MNYVLLLISLAFPSILKIISYYSFSLDNKNNKEYFGNLFEMINCTIYCITFAFSISVSYNNYSINTVDEINYESLKLEDSDEEEHLK